jgi:hypothetical protein
VGVGARKQETRENRSVVAPFVMSLQESTEEDKYLDDLQVPLEQTI